MACTSSVAIFALALAAAATVDASEPIADWCNYLEAVPDVSKFWSYIAKEPVMVAGQESSTLSAVFRVALTTRDGYVCLRAYKYYAAVVRNRCEKYAAVLSKFGAKLIDRDLDASFLLYVPLKESAVLRSQVLKAVSLAVRSLVAGLGTVVAGDCVTVVALTNDLRLMSKNPEDPSVLGMVLSAMASSYHNRVIFHSLNSDLDNRATAKTVLDAVQPAKDNRVTVTDETQPQKQSSTDYKLYKSVLGDGVLALLSKIDQLKNEILVNALERISEIVLTEFGSDNDEFVSLEQYTINPRIL